MSNVNIRDFGAVGDGVTFDSAAIQKAFDTVSAAGGGKVIIPPGTYLVANLQLRSNLTIELQTGARLLGPDNSEPYEVDATVNPNSLSRYMICGRNVRNVVITGGGVIDNAGENFWEQELCNGVVRRAKPKRPVVMYFFECTDITLQGFRIENAAAYTIWMLGCRDVRISGLTIRNDRKGPNTDALDIDSCTNVRISDCDIVAGDDCIALKSDLYRLKKIDAVCEKIVVSNCILVSSTCAIRIGYEGDGVIRDCVFNGIVCCDSAKAIAMQSLVPPGVNFTEINKGTPIENMIFSNFVLRNVDRAFFIRAGNDAGVPGYQAYIRDISISNIRGGVNKESFIGSTDGYYISGVRMDNVFLKHAGAVKSPEGDFPNIWGHVHFPQAVLGLRYIKDIRMDNVEITGAVPLHWRFIENGYLNGSQMPESNNN